ncbi:MAG: ATP-binding cassette domain-containing protein [Candidatus Latescibacterota bacterium]|nr:MAG: ATP-binding cassette domain-containing protein [Candidatus Latescibacterota bacterium]
MAAAIEIEGASKRFNGFLAVDSLDLAIPEGEVYGLLGPNGAGKTTTIRMILGIILPDAGRVRILGQPYDAEVRKRIGYLPEERGLYPKMKLGDQLDFIGGLDFIPRAERRRRIDEWCERFDLTSWKNHKVEELSRGMQQKVQFIATVLHDPEVLMLDEPFTGLDPVNTKLLKDIMLDFAKRGKTVILSTHRMEQVEMLCDRICLINKGRKVVDGALAEVKAQHGGRTVQVEYDGSVAVLEGHAGVERVDNYGKYAEVHLREEADTQALLASLVREVKVRRFEVMTPSINDIFIQLVGGDAPPPEPEELA